MISTLPAPAPAGGGMMVTGQNRGMMVAGNGNGMVVAGAGPNGAAVCCGDGSAMNACCADGSGGGGAGQMTFVGGGGSYIAETTYKYVGNGAGEFAYLTPKRNMLGCFLGGLGCALLAILLIVIFMWADPTTTTPKTVGPIKACLIWGDPHFDTFDRAFPNFYGEGERWWVKTPSIHIQGRHLATPFTKGLAATHAVAISGPFINNHVIVVGPMENGQITLDGNPILTGFPSTYNLEGSELSYNGFGKLVDNAQGHLEKHIVHMELPDNVHVQVMRWANHINVRIEMPQFENVDGACGNFNGNPGDDSLQAIHARMGTEVPQNELIFNHVAPVVPHKALTMNDCPEHKKVEARALCLKNQPNINGVLLESCTFDVCFGGKQYAGEDGLIESEA